MIGRLRGIVAEHGDDGSIVLDVQGVGYDVFVPLGALGRLPPSANEVVLHIHTHVREDAFQLFGFATPQDRTAFRTLLTVSSVGPRLALSILSHFTAEQLAKAIAREDRDAFKGISGVGKKIVERLVLELKDKMSFVAFSASSPGIVSSPVPSKAQPSSSLTGVARDVSSALVNLGFKLGDAERAAKAVMDKKEGDASATQLSELVREALTYM